MVHYNWMKWIWTKEQDRILWSNKVSLLHDLPRQDNVISEDNQYTRLDGRLRMFCTGFNALMLIRSIYNVIDFSDDDWEEYRKYSQYKYWYEEWEPNLSRTWVECARTYWNTKEDHKVNSWRRDVQSKDVDDVLDLWYWIALSYRWNSKYNNDYQTDNILDGFDFWPYTYWHMTCCYRIDWYNYIVDSSYWKPYNRYRLKSDFKKLVWSWLYYPTAYIMTPELTPEEVSFKKEYEYWIELWITTVPYEEAEQRKKETVVQDVRVYNSIVTASDYL